MNYKCQSTNGLYSDCIEVAALKQKIEILEKALEFACIDFSEIPYEYYIDKEIKQKSENDSYKRWIEIFINKAKKELQSTEAEAQAALDKLKECDNEKQ